MSWIEVRATKRRLGDIALIRECDLTRDYRGYRSVFSYPDIVAKRIRDTQSTADLRDQPVCCNVIFVDYDNEPEVAARAVTLLKTMGIGFEVWHSGGRSVHLHISTGGMVGTWVVETIKGWVSRFLGPQDTSYYVVSGMFRLPFTIHESTYQPKTLTEVVIGKPLILHQGDFKPMTSAGYRETSDPHEINQQLYRTLLSPCGEGSRRVRLSCCIVRDCVALGMSEQRTLELALQWNALRCNPPLGQDEVYQRVAEGYRT